MPYAQNFIRLSWGGTMGSDEIWTNNVHLTAQTGQTQRLTALMADGARRTEVVNLLRAFHASTNGSVQDIRLGWVKFALIAPDGKYIGQAQTAFFSDVPGGYTIDHFIGAFTSLAISFKTDIIRGPGANGRIYPPANAAFNTIFAADIERRNTLATAYAGLVGDINDAVSTDTDVILVSNVSNSGSGVQSPVTSVNVGDVMDVQRRRKNKIRENYQNVPV